VSPEVLLIEPDHAILDRLINPIQAAGFEVVHADEFFDAVDLLRTRPFAAVITAHRLGAYNGLHVVLRARRLRPGIITIVTCTKEDSVLCREANMFGAKAIVAPWENPAELLVALKAPGIQIA
jgi:DNA-binding response OmpR family regulator